MFNNGNIISSTGFPLSSDIPFGYHDTTKTPEKRENINIISLGNDSKVTSTKWNRYLLK